MKKTILLSTFTSLMLLASGCKAVDPVQECDEYTDCVVYAVDTISGVGVASDYAKIAITANMASGLFSMQFTDFKLSPEGAVCASTVNGLQQYMKDVRDAQGNLTDVTYAFFEKTGNAYADGDMPVYNLRFGWLSTVYWCTFASNRHRVWSLPREVLTYSNRVTCVNERLDTIDVQTAPARFDVEFNTYNNTVTFRGTAVTYPTDNTDIAGYFRFKSLMFESRPVKFDAKGFSIESQDFTPVTDGERGTYKITNFTCRFDADYDGERTAEFDIANVSSGVTMHVITSFDYFQKK